MAAIGRGLDIAAAFLSQDATLRSLDQVAVRADCHVLFIYFWLLFGLVYVVLAIIGAKRRGEHISNVMEDHYAVLRKHTVVVMIVIVVLVFVASSTRRRAPYNN
jgi:hypothetical protein